MRGRGIETDAATDEQQANRFKLDNWLPEKRGHEIETETATDEKQAKRFKLDNWLILISAIKLGFI